MLDEKWIDMAKEILDEVNFNKEIFEQNKGSDDFIDAVTSYPDKVKNFAQYCDLSKPAKAFSLVCHMTTD